MSTKMLSSLTDENKNLQKQIGCMNGIFQLFDRHHFLNGRRISGSNRKKLLPGANHTSEPKGAIQQDMEKHLKEDVKEKHRVSVESSRTSFSSSSCSSTFSSIDHNKIAPVEAPPTCQSNHLEARTGTVPGTQRSSSSNLSNQSLDLRDVVKDSMHREARSLSVKTLAKEGGKSHVMKHIDSPRPMHQNKYGTAPVQATAVGSPRRMQHPKAASIQTLHKLQEVPWSFKEEKDGPLRLAAKDLPRFSCDGRESREKLKANIKLKDLPRLSLDSKECSLRSSAMESRSNFLLRDLERVKGNSNHIPNPTQEPGSNKRASSVVAKLMGLEALPDSISTCDDDTHSRTSKDFECQLSTRDESCKKNQASWSPPVPCKDTGSPRPRNTAPAMKSMSNSRFPLEPAPWKQPDISRGSQKPALGNKAQATAQLVSSSVYGEMERRISQLEFAKSGKDLRALKQILGAMQKTREKLESQQDDQASQTSTSSPAYSSPGQCYTSLQHKQNNHHLAPTNKGVSPPKRSGSPTVITRPAKLTDKQIRISSSSAATVDASHLQKIKTQSYGHNRKDLLDKMTDWTPRSNNLKDPGRQLASINKKTNERPSKAIATSKSPKYMKAEHHITSGRSSGTVSPRMQQKLSRPTSPSSDLGRVRRQSSKHDNETGTLYGNLKPRIANMQRGDEQLTANNIDASNLRRQGETASVLSESSDSLISQIETEVTSMDHSIKITAGQQKGPQDINPSVRLRDATQTAELPLATLEQPSPVSVLDAAFYEEDLPSPVKKISTAFKDDETLDLIEDERPENQADLPESRRQGPKSEFNMKKLENIKQLVHKLSLLNSDYDEATKDQIACLSKGPNPDHRYITKILLASGLLKDLDTVSIAIQLYSSGYLINPDLFYVLEQTEASSKVTNEQSYENDSQVKSDQKIHRKIIFDIVNEILVKKLASEGSVMLRKKSLSGQGVLRELFTEVDHLKAKSNCCLDDEDDELVSILHADMQRESEDWACHHGELPALVLDIERLIFKDLVSEVISAEVVNLQAEQRRYCRQLFTKQ